MAVRLLLSPVYIHYIHTTHGLILVASQQASYSMTAHAKLSLRMGSSDHTEGSRVEQRNRDGQWELIHSLWIAWTLALGLLSWVGFLWIGLRTRQPKWIIAGFGYLVPLVLVWSVDLKAPGLFPNLVGLGWFVMWLVSIVHAFRSRKEYLMRLKALQGLEEREEVEYRTQVPLSDAEIARMHEADARRALTEFEQQLNSGTNETPQHLDGRR